MLYYLEQAPTQDSIIQQAIKLGRPIPQKLQNSPELLPGLELYFFAFFELSSCRSLGFSEGPIPWTAKKQYCDEHEILGEQRATLYSYISEMDLAYLQYVAKKINKK